MGAGALPSDLAPEPPDATHGIHEQLEVVASGWIAMQVDAPGRLGDPPNLQQPHRHEHKVRLHPLAVRLPCRLDHGIGGGVAVGQFAMLAHVHVVERPCVLERRPGGLGAYRCLELTVRVEGRIEIDKIDAGVVHAAHDGEIVGCPNAPAGEVEAAHAARLRYVLGRFGFGSRAAISSAIHLVSRTVVSIPASIAGVTLSVL